MNRSGLVGLFLAATFVASTAPAAEGFALPKGDIARGKKAFSTLGCAECHAVFGVTDLPLPKIKPAVPLLGGHVRNAPTDADLVAAILNPNGSITKTIGAPHTANPDGTSRMPDFTERMTARDLIDIVAFLHSRDWRELKK